MTQSHVWHDSITCVTWHIYPARVYMNESCHTCDWVMSHMWLSHVTHVIESFPLWNGVMSHVWRSQVTRMKESCNTYEGVMSHIRMNHVTHTKESCHTWSDACTLPPDIYIFPVRAYLNESFHPYEWVMSHIRMSHVTHDLILADVLNLLLFFL